MDRESHPRHAGRRQDRLSGWYSRHEPSTAVSLPASHRAHQGRLLQDTGPQCCCCKMRVLLLISCWASLVLGFVKALRWGICAWAWYEMGELHCVAARRILAAARFE